MEALNNRKITVGKTFKEPSFYVLILLFFYSLIIYPGCAFDTSGLDTGVWNDPIPPPDGCIGQYYYYDLNSWFALYHFKKPLTYKIKSVHLGHIPVGKIKLKEAGLVLDENKGIIQGIPLTGGKWKVEIEVEDSSTPDKKTSKNIFSFQFNAFSIVTPGDLLPICINQAYEAVIKVCGGTPPFSWEIPDKSWSPTKQPLKFKSQNTTSRQNTITGTPNKSKKGSWENYEFKVYVEDKFGPLYGSGATLPIEKKFKLAVTDDLTILTPQKLKDGFVGEKYSDTIKACGGNPPYKWKITDGTLPTPLSLKQSGNDAKINSSKPTKGGNYSFEVALEDQGTEDAGSHEYPTYGSFDIRIASLLKINDSKHILYECMLPVDPKTKGPVCIGNVSGGMGKPYWQVKSGESPPGISLRPDGCFGGMPSTAGVYTFKATAIDKTTDPSNPPEANITVEVKAKPTEKDTGGLVIERFRQGPYGSATYPENVIDLSDQKPFKVDFRITGTTSWESTWNGLNNSKRQVTLKLLGICKGVKITTNDINPWDPKNKPYDVDGDGNLEHVARFQVSQLSALVSAAGGVQKSPFDFRIIITNLENKKGLIKKYKNVTVK